MTYSTFLAEILRHLFRGVFATLCGIGYAIWESIRRRNFNTGQATDNLMPMPDEGA